jgi:beta-phosphoglucomutase-like phosphatase (HAD superfamily)
VEGFPSLCTVLHNQMRLAYRMTHGLISANKQQLDSITPFINPSQDSFPPRDVILTAIHAECERSTYKAYLRIKELKKDIATLLRNVVGQVVHLGHDAPVKQDGGATAEKLQSILSNYLIWCEHIPGPPELRPNLVKRANELIEALNGAKLQEWTKGLEFVIAKKVVLFEKAANDFLVYRPFKNCIEAVGQSEGDGVRQVIRHSMPYNVFLRLMENPKAFLFDVDDLVAMTEKQQKLAWGIALRDWGNSNEFRSQNRRTSSAVIEELVTTVEECLVQDRTAGLLQLLCDIMDQRGVAFDVPTHMSKNQALEKILNTYRGRVLARYVAGEVKGEEIRFAPGAAELIHRLYYDGFKLAFVTNTPKEVSEQILRPLCRDHAHIPDLDVVVPEHHRVFGDITPFGILTPIRKSHPAMWLAGARAVGVSPRDAVVLDNSLGNCAGVSELSLWDGDPILTNFERELFSHPASEHIDPIDGRRPLFDIGENFRAVIGVTNGHGDLDPWQEWIFESQKFVARRGIPGCNVTTRVLVERLSQIET